MINDRIGSTRAVCSSIRRSATRRLDGGRSGNWQMVQVASAARWR